jgi:phosphoribosylamine-glycine ligase
MMDEINAQITRENTNLVGIQTYIKTLSDNISFTTLAEEPELRVLMTRVAQNKQWQTYFEQYADTQNNLNPIYTTNTDSDKSAVIDQVLAVSGLPDVTDATDLIAVAAKARRDDRIDTAGYDRLTVEKQISDASKQLLITTANRTITALSGTLLRNMNQHDRDEIARRLDLNESANTLS